MLADIKNEETKVDISNFENVHQEQFMCKHCDYKVASKFFLQMHIERKHDRKTFPCLYCDHKATRKYTLRRHIDVKHNDKEPIPKLDRKKNPKLDRKKIPCRYCDFKATKNYNLRKHIYFKHIEEAKVKSEPKRAVKKNFKCPYCQYKTDRNYRLARHMDSKHNGHLKEQNTLTFKHNIKEPTVKSEPKRSLRKKYQCQHCQYKTDRKYHFARHMDSKHNRSEEQKTLTSQAKEVYYVQCDLCEYIATSDQHLIEHVELKHEKANLKKLSHSRKKRLFPCQHCSHKATRKDSLNIHIEAIHSNKIFQCEFCDYIGTTRKNLNNHKRSKHVTNVADSQRCERCDRTFATESSFQEHMNYHRIMEMDEEQIYPCLKCEFRATKYGALENHIETVHG